MGILENVGSMFSASVNVTTAVADLTSAPLFALQRQSSVLWNGVDVFDLDVQVKVGELICADPDEAVAPLALELGPLFEEFAPRIRELLGHASFSVPWVDAAETNLLLNSSTLRGRFYTLELGAITLPAGWLGVSWIVLSARFSFQWFNPFWEALNFSLRDEEPQVVLKLEGVLLDTRRLNPVVFAFRPDSFDDMVAPMPSSWARVLAF